MNEQAQGTNLLEIAKSYGNVAFLEWFRMRLGQSNVVMSGIYTPNALYVAFLEQRNNVYQRWERQEDFPVRSPMKATGRTGPRLYTPQQFVSIVHWYWHKKVTEQRYVSIQEVIELLGEVGPLVEDGLQFEGTGNAAVISVDHLGAFLRPYLPKGE